MWATMQIIFCDVSTPIDLLKNTSMGFAPTSAAS